jgi:hypothetical protein
MEHAQLRVSEGNKAVGADPARIGRAVHAGQCTTARIVDPGSAISGFEPLAHDGAYHEKGSRRNGQRMDAKYHYTCLVAGLGQYLVQSRTLEGMNSEVRLRLRERFFILVRTKAATSITIPYIPR